MCQCTETRSLEVYYTLAEQEIGYYNRNSVGVSYLQH
jgi:hypothetical protein